MLGFASVHSFTSANYERYGCLDGCTRPTSKKHKGDGLRCSVVQIEGAIVTNTMASQNLVFTSAWQIDWSGVGENTWVRRKEVNWAKVKTNSPKHFTYTLYLDFPDSATVILSSLLLKNKAHGAKSRHIWYYVIIFWNLWKELAEILVNVKMNGPGPFKGLS